MAFKAQKRKELRKKCNGTCYYCDLPMMPLPKNNPGAKQNWLAKHGLDKNERGSRAFCRATKETVEHLTRKADGGGNNTDNLVLAHQICNSLRGETFPKDHRKVMLEQINNPLSPLYVIANHYGKGE